MVKIIGSSNFVSSVHKKLMNKISKSGFCKEGEKIVTLWRFDNRPPHAGQLQGCKILPNGNKQVRITTAYAGDAHVISTDTRIYSPEGELLKAYHGIRGAEMKYVTPKNELIKHILPTQAYANDAEGVAKIIRLEQKLNPGVKYLPDLPKA